MTIRETKQYLSRYNDTLKEIKALQSNLYSIRQTMDGLKAQTLSGMPSGSGHSDKLANAVDRIASIELMIHQKIEALSIIIEEINYLIDSIDNPVNRTILRYRYIDCMKWEDICFLSHYSWRHVHRIHSAALYQASLMIQ